MPLTGQLWPPQPPVMSSLTGQLWPRRAAVTAPVEPVFDITALSADLIAWWRPESLPLSADNAPLSVWPSTPMTLTGPSDTIPGALTYPSALLYPASLFTPTSDTLPGPLLLPSEGLTPTSSTAADSRPLLANPVDARYVSNGLNGKPGVTSTSGLTADLSDVAPAVGWTAVVVASGGGVDVDVDRRGTTDGGSSEVLTWGLMRANVTTWADVPISYTTWNDLVYNTPSTVSWDDVLDREATWASLVTDCMTWSVLLIPASSDDEPLRVRTLTAPSRLEAYSATGSASAPPILPDGTFAPPVSGPAMLTTADLDRVATANAWLAGMTQTATVITTTSTITPTAEYASSYVGAVTGTFILRDRTYPVEDDAVVVITSPTPLLGSDVTSVVSGHVIVPPTPGRWIIQVYRRLAGLDTMVSKQALADGSTGAFTIDLSTVPENLAGDWVFGILDADSFYAPYGEKWPHLFYAGLEVQQLVITDSVYLWNSCAAMTNGVFGIPSSTTGLKIFRLVDTASGDVLAEHVKPTGLIRSYAYASGETGYGTSMANVTFLYDQAIALFAAIGAHQDVQAQLLVAGLLRAQATSGAHTGAFLFSTPQLSPGFGDPFYRTGAHAICTDALLAYIQAYPADINITACRAAAVSALAFLDTVLATTGPVVGLYAGGFGTYVGDPQVFDPDYVIPWFSTEHNIDIWHTLIRAGRALGNSPVDYHTKATALDAAIVTYLYSTAEQRYNQGVHIDGPDTADPLDVSSWGGIQMLAAGRVTQALQAVARIDGLFQRTRGGITGYATFYDSPGYPGATPMVWFEGSFGVALAFYRLGNYEKYRSIIDDLSAAQESDGSFRYATDVQPLYEITTSRSVAGTAWFVLATASRDTIWNVSDATELGMRFSQETTVTTPWVDGAPYETGGPMLALAGKGSNDLLIWSLGTAEPDRAFAVLGSQTAARMYLHSPPGVAICEVLLFAGADRLTVAELRTLRGIMIDKYAAVPAAPPPIVEVTEPPLGVNVSGFSQPVLGWWRPEGLQFLELAMGARVPYWLDSSGQGRTLLDNASTSPRLADGLAGWPGVTCDDGGLRAAVAGSAVGVTAFVVTRTLGIRSTSSTGAVYLELRTTPGGSVVSSPLRVGASMLGTQDAVSIINDGAGFIGGALRVVQTSAPYEDLGQTLLVAGKGAAATSVWPLRQSAPSSLATYTSDDAIVSSFPLSTALPYDEVVVNVASGAVICEVILFAGTDMLTPTEIATVRNYLLAKYPPTPYVALGPVADTFARSAIDLRGTVTSTGGKVWSGDAVFRVGTTSWGSLQDVGTWQAVIDYYSTWGSVVLNQLIP